jgi:hypothetical protein
MADRRIANVKRQIARNGQKAIWRQTVDGLALDPSKPWLPSESETVEYLVDIVFLPDYRFNFQGEKYYPETEVRTGFGVAYMGAQEFVPRIKDIIVRDGVELVVRTIRALNPSGEDLFYQIEIGQ